MKKNLKKLALCILLDAIGIIPLLIPVVGEILDVIWAPIAASVSYKMFGDKRGKYTSAFTFVEELLPFTDILPTFTIFCILFDFIGLGKEKREAVFMNAKYA